MEKRFLDTAERLVEIQAKIKFLKTQAVDASAKLQAICGNETTSFKGYTYSKIKRKGAIKYSLIPELKRVDLEPYRGDLVISWKLKYEQQFEEV